MKRSTVAVGFVLLFACQALAGAHSVLARFTVYWHREGSGEHASWNGVPLGEKHCAVDPKKIPYGSKVFFGDVACVVVDSGPDDISRKPARLLGRNDVDRSALVVDRLSPTQPIALPWAQAHPPF